MRWIVFIMLFLMAEDAQAAWSFVAHRGSANEQVSDTTISVNPTATLAVGSIILVRTVSDNITLTTGDTTDHTISDSAGNNWTRLKEHTRGDSGAALSVTHSLWMSDLTSQITTAGTITLTTASAVVAKAIAIEELSVGSGKTFSLLSGNAAVFGNNLNPSVTLSGLASAEHLWIGQIGGEGPDSDTFTQDADYANNTSFGTNAGAALTNVYSRFGTRVFTGTSDTYGVTIGITRDVSIILIALNEVDDAGPIQRSYSDTLGLTEGFSNSLIPAAKNYGPSIFGDDF